MNVQNIFACLVHESPECVLDLVRNLRHLDPSSTVLLYDGGQRAQVHKSGLPFEPYGAVLVPAPMPQAWGRLHGFALACMQFALDHWKFDTLTIVDSDQLATRAGYSEHLAHFLRDRQGIGLLGNSPGVMKSSENVGPVKAALQEVELWRPFLRRFPAGEDKFPHWSFWPSTVFTANATRDITRLFATDRELQNILNRTRIWATEEVILPTLAALLGYQIAANPCSYDYVQYQVPYTLAQLDIALAKEDVFWIHPVPRQFNHPLRRRIRERLHHYDAAYANPPTEQEEALRTPLPPSQGNDVVQPLPILEKMRNIQGWLEDEEADLLIATASRALAALPAGVAVVEVGSFCGKATVVLGSVVKALNATSTVYAIDPHDGKVGALDRGLQYFGRTLATFQRNVAETALTETVETIPKHSSQVSWEKPIGFLLIDHLHDYPSVARDFHNFEKWILPGGYVAFHDYADYYPGVKSFVNELLAQHEYRQVHCANSMMVLRREPSPENAQTVATPTPRQVAPETHAIPASVTAVPAAVTSEPLVSCLMPTADRRSLAPQAIRHFLRQNYPNRELIILDDGDDSIADLVPSDDSIRYIRLPEKCTIGAKHNMGCQLARGQVIVHWDDDDWVADWRLSYQVKELLQKPPMTISGLSRLLFYEPSSDRAWEYIYGMRTPLWVSGATFCYQKAFWERHHFPDMNEGGDTLFVWNLRNANIFALADYTFYVATVHARNTSPKRTETAGWRPIPSQRIQRLLDEQSWSFYRRPHLLPPRRTNQL